LNYSRKFIESKKVLEENFIQLFKTFRLFKSKPITMGFNNNNIF